MFERVLGDSAERLGEMTGERMAAVWENID